MRINNFVDVRNSRFLNSLDKQAKQFGLQSCYADITEPGYEGIYFFCGTDLNSYLKTEDDIKAVIKRSSLDDCFLLKARSFKLNGYDDFVAHQHIMIYMHNSELLQRIYKEKNIPLPKKIDSDSVINIRNLYANTINTKNLWRKASYESQLIKEMKGEASSLKFENEHFVYDSGKSKFVNFLRKHFKKNHSEVSLAHLTATSASIETISIKAQYRNDIIKALNKNPTILYHASKIVGEVFQTADGEGFGPNPEDNDLRHFTLSFNELYREEVMDIVNRTLYPELCKQNAEALNREYGDLIPFSIPTYEWQNLTNLLNTNNIPFAYDVNRHETFDISLVVPQCFEPHLEAVLDRLAKEKEDFKICAFPIVSSEHFHKSEKADKEVLSPAELQTAIQSLKMLKNPRDLDAENSGINKIEIEGVYDEK